MKTISNVRDQYKKRAQLAAAHLDSPTKVVLSEEAVHYCLAHSDPNGYGDWSMWDKVKSGRGKETA